MAQDLPGFRQFVTRCMIQMSRVSFNRNQMYLLYEALDIAPKLRGVNSIS